MGTENLTGSRLVAIRELKKLSREELALRCHLNVGQIEQIEAGTATPAIGTLVKLARALGVRPGTFTDDQEHEGPIVCRNGSEQTVGSLTNKNAASHEHLTYMSLAREKAGRHMEPFLVNISSAPSKPVTTSTHEGEEFIYVIEGAITITYGTDTYLLSQGDSIYYDSIVPHRIEAQGTQARILAVVYAPF